MSNGDHTIDRNLFDVYHDSVLFVKINNTQQRRTNTLYVLNTPIERKYCTRLPVKSDKFQWKFLQIIIIWHSHTKQDTDTHE